MVVDCNIDQGTVSFDSGGDLEAAPAAMDVTPLARITLPSLTS